jgi:carboxypeptidase Q
MKLRLSLLLAAAAVVSIPAAAAEDVSRTQINRLLDEGLNRSQVMETAHHLTDRIGGRLTNSPQMREAERWTQQRLREFGLSNVRAEPFEFGRGWSIVSSSARMTAPRVKTLVAIPVAWTPATNGTISAGIAVAPMREAEDFEKYRGKLRGRIVLVSHPGAGSEPMEAPFKRLGDDDLRKLDTYQMPNYSPLQIEKSLREADFAEKRDSFLKAEGALAWVQMSRRDGSLLHGQGSGYRIGRTPALPAFEISAEDYRRLARLALTDAPPTLELTSDVRFHDEDVNAYNILADLPGTDPRAGYVMAGAHLDSWAAGDGAADNAAGSAVVIEAARILARLGVRPKRTIRFALWAGEEQGLLGSLAYVERHIGTRPPPEERYRHLRSGQTWRYRWPLTLKPGHGEMIAYFNLDNGSGKIRGINTEGNVAAGPIFREWLAPFAGLGANTVAVRPTGSTDHVYFQQVGLPGYQFIQDPLDYSSRLHHTNVDTYDHLKADDLRQASVIMAAFLLNAANRAEPLPRMPVPTQPRPTDPFEYPAED